MGTDCVTSCINTISALNLTDTTLSTATFTWDDTEANSWQVGYALFGEEITNWQDVIQNSFIAEGLEANTYYTLSVRNACGTGITAGSKTLSFSTGANWCSGAVWTDTGGATGNYTGTQHTVTIIKPQSSNQAVTVTFNDFWTQLNDILYVYDGIGTSAPLIGNYSGYTPPTEPFVATNVSGALTFEFITDQMVYPSDGWAATVECLLSSKDLSFANLQYYPSPVRETITITAPNGFSNITLYNMAGQLLSSRNVEATSDVIDMSAYSSGIYILKISRGNTETHLKIIKE
ncbi:MAG: T9SS type A sorting domain-containing protein [Bacteroidota bacterium]